jgi:hypothetical protein
MKIDDKARAYFDDRETLERFDDLWLALKDYFRDLSIRLFNHLERRLNDLSKTHKDWILKREKSATETGVLLYQDATNRYGAAIEVGF